MPMSFTVAYSKFFGRKQNQSLGEFAKELAELTAQDRIEMAPMLSAELGVEVELTPEQQAS